MDYSVLADYYEKLESVSSKLKKRDILAELFRITPTEELPKVVLLVQGSPKEVRYIARTILEDLRVGVAEGIIRDAIVEAFLAEENVSKEEKQKISDLVEYSYNIVSDFGEVAKIAKEGGVEALKKVKVQIGKPIQGMLGLAAESIEEVVKEFGTISAQYKYDESRVQIHRSDATFWVYTRRLEDITKQFPDIVEFCK